ncbi:MAG: hypothetical protein JO312_14610 [Hyphomicrobiales bacterium]|nr:hypothetical protein [Hyphomicrobiales bacterium]
MTYGALHVSAIALGVAALVSISPLSTARADSSAPSGATPSLSEPAPTPSVATSPPSGTASTPSGAAPSLSEPAPTPSVATGPQRPSHIYVRHYARHTHYAWRNGRRYAAYSYDNPVAAAATGVVGGMADLGSIAAYPVYCFPRYGSCRVRLPYP